MHLKNQRSTARRGRISMTLYGRTVLFGPSIRVHFDCDRCDYASLCSVICAARRLQTPQTTSGCMRPVSRSAAAMINARPIWRMGPGVFPGQAASPRGPAPQRPAINFSSHGCFVPRVVTSTIHMMARDASSTWSSVGVAVLLPI